MNSKEKKFFVFGFLSAIISLAVIAFAAAATQGHPWTEIDFSEVGKCSNICTDDDYDDSALHSCDECASQFVDTAGDTMTGNLTMNGNMIKKVDKIKFQDRNSDNKIWTIGESTTGKFLIGLLNSGTLENVLLIDIDGNIKINEGNVSANAFLGTHFFKKMVCRKAENNCSDSKSCSATCPSGYYLVWGGCSSIGSLNSQNIWDSHCTSWSGNFCTNWTCTTASNTTKITAQAFCCK